MFLDSELKRIREAKENLAKRCALRRMMLQLDVLAVRANVQEAFTGLTAGLAVAELVKDLLSNRKNQDR